eukprot:GFYU01003235.1.p1 GENE.GFYU01003235.1~~GFYU01003235.1.p1  ORF type:complete len:493 (-),score=124.78 GFYU01003235.1:28-1506(-)
MRQFESYIIYGMLADITIRYWYSHAEWKIYSPMVLAMILGVHAAVENTRWQLTPVYLLAGFNIMGLDGLKWFGGEVGMVGGIFQVVVVMATAALSCYLPVRARVPVPGAGHGKHAQFEVGMVEDWWKSDALPEGFGVRILYPIDKTAENVKLKAESTVKYFPDGLETPRGLAKVLGQDWLAFLFYHLALTTFDVVPGAALSDAQTKYPVLTFSHGLVGSRAWYSGYCADVASHGYVVVVLDHGDGTSVYNKTPQGNVIPYSKKPQPDMSDLEFRESHLNHRMQELDVMMDTLERVAKGGKSTVVSDTVSSLFSNRIDGDRICIGGHSFGGASSYQYSTMEKNSMRFKCVVLMDPWMVPISDEYRTKGAQVPSLWVDSDWQWEKNRIGTETGVKNSDHSYWFNLQGTYHQSLSDFSIMMSKFVARKVRLIGDHDPQAAHNTFVDITVSFMEKYMNPSASKNLPTTLRMLDVGSEERPKKLKLLACNPKGLCKE